MTIRDSSQRERYLGDLLTLGRLQLRSSSSQNIADAVNTYADALKFCQDAGGFAPRRRAACLALRAKAKLKQGRLSDSDADFNEAINIVNGRKDDQSVFHDILLERSVLRIHTRRFAGGLG